ncbi:anti-sigma factor [Cellulomonas wangsupingiae]|uniref:Anti-sigma factor n=1 Tax=Cellulomonas wangsupingiae TaxID=2968085 RepID=A0ABY5K765_9CELL|nr:anti-sigma factor [Cellulomonas wangsupingiae]MCC2335132.1 anti-sigma factor [Cellulomonas wangsupingiae]UUI65628.1 anti-sigma factor [Cellulomonas wangsupingiae]
MVPFDDLHVDDETLALLALGEQVGTADDHDHVAACPRCADELAALHGVAALARESGPDPHLVTPDPQVWGRVAAELGLGERAHAAARGELTERSDVERSDVEHPDAAPTAPPPPAADPSAPGAPAEPPLATVTPLASRRRVRRAWLAVAAAAGLVVGGAGATAWVQLRTDPSTVLASAVLEPLPGWSPTGTAEVRTARDGSRELVVDLDSAPQGDGFLEVWLLRPDVSGLVSLGTLDGTSGTFALPADLDLAEYPVVDVSDEPLDGEPAHSGVSVVRGALDA